MVSLNKLMEQDELDDFVRAFESAYSDQGLTDLAEFLPADDHPLYPAVLRELVRVDMEYRWERGCPRLLGDYQRAFPTLGDDPAGLSAIAFEEFRLRRQAGENPLPSEYQERFGVVFEKRMLDWPAPVQEPAEESSEGPSSHRAMLHAAQAYRDFRGRFRDGDGAAEALESWCASYRGAPAEVFRDLHLQDRDAAYGLARSVTMLPEVGDKFLGFQLVSELGEGAFGRVYLARQGELADRSVVLKITTLPFDESRALAQLQHTNIVPIYSKHRADPYQAVCMPYFGVTTLRDVYKDIQEHDSLPESGEGLLSTLRSHQSRSSQRSTDPSQSPGGAGDPAVPSQDVSSQPLVAAVAEPATETLRMLGSLSYVEAVLWMAARLAAGLAHAHERGIIHRDLKPANILLTDDGQPMLLDFNLAEDTKLRRSASAAAVGGTLPYMAPEHLEAFCGGTRPVDARSDIYSLGVILYELLTGKPPFPHHRGATSGAGLRQMLEDRLAPPPRLRAANPAVSPAVESIVRHCLEPDPAARYQSARALQEDLQRHLEHEPLRHAPEPSLRERVWKWTCRHPRLGPWLLGGVCLTLVVSLVVALLAHHRQNSRLGASQTLDRFQEHFWEAQYHLTSRLDDPVFLAKGLDEAESGLALYGLDNGSTGLQPDSVYWLPSALKGKVAEDAAVLLVLVAWGKVREAADQPEGPERRALLAEALKSTELAAKCLPLLSQTRSFGVLRAGILGKLGRGEEADRARAEAAELALKSARDYFLEGVEKLYANRLDAASPLFARATQDDPDNYAAWYLSAKCRGIPEVDDLRNYDRAVADYSVCIALQPKNPAGWTGRGVVRGYQGHHEDAIADFTEALRLRPNRSELYIDRALAEFRLKRFDDALRDLSHALELPGVPTRVYFIRAQVKSALGDKEGSERDLREGLALKPSDEVSWVARGVARTTLKKDHQGALDDFNQALAFNPRSFLALNNKVHILGERLGRTEEAVHALDDAIDRVPSHLQALTRSVRGVYLARLGRREAALNDAESALAQEPGPAITYRVAGIYALTSRQVPDDRFAALELLASSFLLSPFGLRQVENDPDLTPIRDLPEFRRIVALARRAQVLKGGQAERRATGAKPR